MTQQDNRRIVLASRPVGAPTQDNFRLETVTANSTIKDGEMLLRSVYLLDPYIWPNERCEIPLPIQSLSMK